jgi:hypothetical protein
VPVAQETTGQIDPIASKRLADPSCVQELPRQTSLVLHGLPGKPGAPVVSVGLLVGIGVSVGVHVGARLLVRVADAVGVGVSVGVGLDVGVDVGVSVSVPVAVIVDVLVAVTVAVTVGVGVFVFVDVAVGETVPVRLAVVVGVKVASWGLWTTAPDPAGRQTIWPDGLFTGILPGGHCACALETKTTTTIKVTNGRIVTPRRRNVAIPHA